MLPGRIAFGGNLVRDAAQTEPIVSLIVVLIKGTARYYKSPYNQLKKVAVSILP